MEAFHVWARSEVAGSVNNIRGCLVAGRLDLRRDQRRAAPVELRRSLRLLLRQLETEEPLQEEMQKLTRPFLRQPRRRISRHLSQHLVPHGWVAQRRRKTQ